MIDRRRLLLGAGALTLAACGPQLGSDKKAGVKTTRYGDDASQFYELTAPTGTSKGVVVVIHGGFWQAQYDLSLGRPLAESLGKQGWTAVNLEYRRVGNGGGWPTTFDDVAAGIDALADTDLDLAKVITLGHSAGGHLGVWAASRTDPKVPVTAAVSQAGVLDLRAADTDNLGGGAVRSLMGDQLTAHLSDADPTAFIPLDIAVRCVHAPGDRNVPISQSEQYVARASNAGADATLTRVDGDHFTLIDPTSPAWASTLDLIESL